MPERNGGIKNINSISGSGCMSDKRKYVHGIHEVRLPLHDTCGRSRTVQEVVTLLQELQDVTSRHGFGNALGASLPGASFSEDG